MSLSLVNVNATDPSQICPATAHTGIHHRASIGTNADRASGCGGDELAVLGCQAERDGAAADGDGESAGWAVVGVVESVSLARRRRGPSPGHGPLKPL